MYFGTSPEFSRGCLCPLLVSTEVGWGFMGTAVVVFIKSLLVWMPIVGISVLKGTGGFLTVQVWPSFENWLSERTESKTSRLKAYTIQTRLRVIISFRSIRSNSRSKSLASVECFLRYLSGEGTSTFAGPIVLIASLANLFSRVTTGLNLDIYLKKEKKNEFKYLWII